MKSNNEAKGGKKQEFNTTKAYVEKVLEEDERARNDDKWLILQVLREMGYDIYIDYEELDEMPAFETITRCRRKFQEEGNYEADEEVQEERKEKEKEVDFSSVKIVESKPTEMRWVL